MIILYFYLPRERAKLFRSSARVEQLTKLCIFPCLFPLHRLSFHGNPSCCLNLLKSKSKPTNLYVPSHKYNFVTPNIDENNLALIFPQC